MVAVPEEVRKIFSEQRVLPMGTADKDGVPNTIYIGSWWWVDDETILVVDNFFRKTRRNLEENPRAALVARSRKERVSYQLKCSASIHTDGPQYENAFKRERSRDDFHYPCRAIVLLKVDEVYNAMYGEGAGEKIL